MASTHILAVGKIEHGGDIEMDISLLPWVDPNEPIELQRFIDEAEMSADYEDYLADVEFIRTGC